MKDPLLEQDGNGELSGRLPRSLVVMLLSALLVSCVPHQPRNLRVPAVEYANRVKAERARFDPAYRQQLARENQAQDFEAANSNQPPLAQLAAARARMNPDGSATQGEGDPAARPDTGSDGVHDTPPGVVSNMAASEGGYNVYRGGMRNTRDYVGPLALGEAGLSPSLWREGSSGTSLFRDYRAWQPMDLITIVVSENSEGKNKADTTVKDESSVEAAIKHFFGLEGYLTQANKALAVDASTGSIPLVSADSKHDFKGEGETKRTGTLKANISAMVQEVLPSGVLRIEGEKIITVNFDDEIMHISGLVRPEDINSSNEVDSSKIANVRIDYTGVGSVSNAQTSGWLGSLMRLIWPF